MNDVRAWHVVVTVAMAACHPASPQEPVDAAQAAPADAYVPTESRPLGLDDLSILLPLPANPAGPPTVARMTGFPGGGDLVSRAAFARLVTDPGDVHEAYDDFHLVAIRFDLCDRAVAGPCAAGADGQLRLVFQPVHFADGTSVPEADDMALHASYPIPATDLAAVVDELRALARIQGLPITSPLMVNPTLASTGSTGEYASRLSTLVARYARADRMVRLTLFAQDANTSNFDWVFRGVQAYLGSFRDLDIATVGATQQRAIFIEWPAPASYDVAPVGNTPAGAQLALQGQMFDAATYTNRATALAALAAEQNPTRYAFGTEQCIACHASTALMRLRAADLGVDPPTVPGTFTSGHDLSISAGISSITMTSLRAFGWFHDEPAISQRVVNETAFVLDEIDQRFPPAPDHSLQP